MVKLILLVKHEIMACKQDFVKLTNFYFLFIINPPYDIPLYFFPSLIAFLNTPVFLHLLSPFE